MRWRAYLGWLLVVVLVGMAYVSVLHTVPWFLALVVIGRLFMGVRLGRRVWIAVTDDQLQVLEGLAEVWSIPRDKVAAIHVARDGASRVQFVDRSGAALVTAPLMFSSRQIARMAEVLAIPVTDHRR